MVGSLQKATLWDCLHDGALSSAETIEPGRLRLTVEIEYLRELLGAGGRGFVVTLEGLKRFELRHYGPASEAPVLSSDLTVIAGLKPEILSAENTASGVCIHCNLQSFHPRSTDYGEIDLDYDNALIVVDDGRSFSIQELLALSKRYWESPGQ